MKRRVVFILIVLILVLTTACNRNGGGNVKYIEREPADCDIGIWYSVWYAYLDEMSNSVQRNTWNAWDIQYDVLLPDGTYGKYDSLDEDFIFFHLEQMADLGIDFVIMDQTNHIDVENGYINERALKFAQCIKEWNDIPENRPIKYCSAIGAIQWSNNAASIEQEAKILWDRYCMQEFGTSDYHYYLDDKPLLIVYGDGGEELWNNYDGKKTYGEMFTIRYADNGSNPGRYGWAFDKGTQLHEEVVVVMPGWNNRKGAPPVMRNQGKWYREQWEKLLMAEKKPEIVVINSFNEYAENTAIFPADTSKMTNEIEKWIDENGEISTTMYWKMTKDYIEQLRSGKYKVFEN